jgi:hypothetical protein
MEFSVKLIIPFRLLPIYAYDAVMKGHNMYALAEFDVTEIRKRLRSQRKDWRNISFFGFLLSAISKAIEDNYEYIVKLIINANYGRVVR